MDHPLSRMDHRYDSVRISGLEIPHSGNYTPLCIILYSVCHKGDTIATVMTTSPPNVTFRRDSVGPCRRMECLITSLLRLASDTRADEFRWNPHTNGFFSVDSMYKALILPEIPVKNNKMIWKMKIPLKKKNPWMVSSSRCNPYQR
jgi:hypothetical protein